LLLPSVINASCKKFDLYFHRNNIWQGVDPPQYSLQLRVTSCFLSPAFCSSPSCHIHTLPWFA
jgi:hypothetical protein